MEKLKMIPGKKYRGSAWVNEYGEIQFRPEQKGSKPSNLSIVIQNDVFSLYENECIFKVSVKFVKKDFSLDRAIKRFFTIATIIQQYIPKK